MSVLDKLFLGIPIYRFLMSILVLFMTLVVRRIFQRYVLKVLKKWAQKTRFEYDDIFIDAIYPPLSALVISAGLFFALKVLNLPHTPYDFPTFIHDTYKVVLSVIAVWAAYRLSDFFSTVLRKFFISTNDDIGSHIANLFKQALRILVVVIGGIMIIQNLGYPVSSLLAGLGIGGLAIALAAQDTLANLFGTVVMLTDKPFKIGDWIQFGEVDGVVESIGFRSTRVRTWPKSLMIIPNKVITSDIIQNWSAMPKRRVRMTIGITYDSPQEKIQQLLLGIRELLRNDSEIDQEQIIVNFTDFSASSLDILVNYFTNTVNYPDHILIRERINFQIMALVEKLGLSFAFPSQTIYMKNL